jgi:membrane-bound metal-dependent hydrolase YbcI (DUF457 family)
MLTALHFFTHVGIGWIVAALGPGPRKDRWLIVLAAVVPDLDGVGILWSEHAYHVTHRVVGHSVLFGLALIAAVAMLADRRSITAALAGLSFVLHVLLDLAGTGGPPISYLWPLSAQGLTYDRHWVLRSWPNVVVMALTLLGVIATAWWRARRRSSPTAGTPAAGLRARSRPPSGGGGSG